MSHSPHIGLRFRGDEVVPGQFSGVQSCEQGGSTQSARVRSV